MTSMTNMSVGATSHLGGPGRDELVPSRYALRVGEIEVLVVSDGLLSLKTPNLATNADPAEVATWLDDMAWMAWAHTLNEATSRTRKSRPWMPFS